jgi:cytochrome c5
MLKAAAVACCAWLGLLAVSAQDGPAPPRRTQEMAGMGEQPPAKGAAAVPPAAAQDAGERKFQQNCRRCHNEPQELSPRITGTVLLHMRVRAGLSQADERAILRYMTQ